MIVPSDLQNEFCDKILSLFPDIKNLGCWPEEGDDKAIRAKLSAALLDVNKRIKKDYGFDVVIWWNGELVCVAKCKVKGNSVYGIDCDFTESTL